MYFGCKNPTRTEEKKIEIQIFLGCNLEIPERANQITKMIYKWFKLLKLLHHGCFYYKCHEHVIMFFSQVKNLQMEMICRVNNL